MSTLCKIIFDRLDAELRRSAAANLVGEKTTGGGTFSVEVEAEAPFENFVEAEEEAEAPGKKKKMEAEQAKSFLQMRKPFWQK